MKKFSENHTPTILNHAQRLLKLVNEFNEIIQKHGSKYVLKSKKTGKTLGTHPSKKKAIAQEVAIKYSQGKIGKKK